MKEIMEETFQSPPTNTIAIISFIAAILTVLSFCFGLVPIPLSTFICDPLTLVSGIIALITSMKALRQIRKTGESGRVLALISAWTGAGVVLTTLSLLSASVLLFPYFADFIKTLWHNFISLF